MTFLVTLKLLRTSGANKVTKTKIWYLQTCQFFCKSQTPFSVVVQTGPMQTVFYANTCHGAQKVPSNIPGQVDFCAGQVRVP